MTRLTWFCTACSERSQGSGAEYDAWKARHDCPGTIIGQIGGHAEPASDPLVEQMESELAAAIRGSLLAAS